MTGAFALLVSVIVGPVPAQIRARVRGDGGSVEAIYVVLEDVLGYELIVPRHFVVLLVSEVVAANAVVASLRSSRARQATLAIAGIVAIAALASDATTYRALAKHGDWKRVGTNLSNATRASDTIAIFGADAIPGFMRYYRDYDRAVSAPARSRPLRHRCVARTLDGRSGSGARAVFERRERVLERREFFENTVLRIEPKP